MNIFFLDKDPFKAASYLYMRHLSKMQLETAQIICTVGTKNGLVMPYKITHKNHPLVLWAGESEENMKWLVNHAHGMHFEWIKKGKTKHRSYNISEYYGPRVAKELPKIGLTNIPIEKTRYNLNDAVIWYRNYYKTAKQHIKLKNESEVIFNEL